MPVRMLPTAESEWPARLKPIKSSFQSARPAVVGATRAPHKRQKSTPGFKYPKTGWKRKWNQPEAPLAVLPAVLAKEPGWWWECCEVSWRDVQIGREREAQLIAEAEREAARIFQHRN
jgi:hypothetical protein